MEYLNDRSKFLIVGGYEYMIFMATCISAISTNFTNQPVLLFLVIINFASSISSICNIAMSKLYLQNDVSGRSIVALAHIICANIIAGICSIVVMMITIKTTNWYPIVVATINLTLLVGLCIRLAIKFILRYDVE